VSDVLDKPWEDPATGPRDGLLGAGGDLNTHTLLMAYRDGVFPWFNEGDPILWWSPDPRAIFEIDGVRCSRSLAKTIKSGKFTITLNTCFERVMRACGETRPQGTWVTDDMIAAYTELHRLGYAHSLETWVTNADGSRELAGGIYGIAIGGLFAGESMFHTVTDASKVALVSLAKHLQSRGYTLFDTQMVTPHTISMGAFEIPREDYLAKLELALMMDHVSFASS
jgi:leucyl/phenylalanyl-tRNA---protein transferase